MNQTWASMVPPPALSAFEAFKLGGEVKTSTEEDDEEDDDEEGVDGCNEAYEAVGEANEAWEVVIMGDDGGLGEKPDRDAGESTDDVEDEDELEGMNMDDGRRLRLDDKEASMWEFEGRYENADGSANEEEDEVVEWWKELEASEPRVEDEADDEEWVKSTDCL